jgi:hypothetical protein
MTNKALTPPRLTADLKIERLLIKRKASDLAASITKENVELGPEH